MNKENVASLFFLFFFPGPFLGESGPQCTSFFCGGSLCIPSDLSSTWYSSPLVRNLSLDDQTSFLRLHSVLGVCLLPRAENRFVAYPTYTTPNSCSEPPCCVLFVQPSELISPQQLDVFSISLFPYRLFLFLLLFLPSFSSFFFIFLTNPDLSLAVLISGIDPSLKTYPPFLFLSLLPLYIDFYCSGKALHSRWVGLYYQRKIKGELFSLRHRVLCCLEISIGSDSDEI